MFNVYFLCIILSYVGTLCSVNLVYDFHDNNNASVEWSYLPRNASNFTCSHLDLKTFPGQKPRTPTYRDREGTGRRIGIKGCLPIKEEGKGQGRGEREARGKVGRGKAIGKGDSC